MRITISLESSCCRGQILRDGSLFMGMTGSDKSDRVKKNFVPKTTGYEYFKKQNGRFLKKKFL